MILLTNSINIKKTPWSKGRIRFLFTFVPCVFVLYMWFYSNFIPTSCFIKKKNHFHRTNFNIYWYTCNACAKNTNTRKRSYDECRHVTSCLCWHFGVRHIAHHAKSMSNHHKLWMDYICSYQEANSFHYGMITKGHQWNHLTTKEKKIKQQYLVTSPIIWPSELTIAPPLPPGWTAAVVSSIAGMCEFLPWTDWQYDGAFALTTFDTAPEQTEGEKPAKFKALTDLLKSMK